VGSFDPSTHAYRDFPTPTAGSNPYGIAANGTKIWFTENNSNVDRIAVLDTAKNNAISEYPIVVPVSGTPHLITIGAGGNPWWTEGWSGTIATLDPAVATPGQCGTTSGTCTGIQRFQAPAPATCSTFGTHTSGIAFQGAAQLVWFDNALTSEVGSFSPSTNAFTMNTLSDCGAHPHDGLRLDGSGNVWFDEQFVDAIGQLIAPPLPPPPTAVPIVATGSASGVGTTSATVAGSVNPNGRATTYHFEYGTSTSYGSQAPASPDPSAGSGTTSQPVSANLTGLSPGSTYHYRLVATNATGASSGSDQTLVTTALPAPTITARPDTSTSTLAGVSFNAPGGPAFECALDAAPFASCTSPWTATGVAVGTHTFRVRVRDPYGNAGPAASATWSVTQPPPTPDEQGVPAESPTQGASGPPAPAPGVHVLPGPSSRASLRGTARVGRALRCEAVNTRVASGYRWLRDGRVVRHEAHATYVVTRRDRGRRLACQVVDSRGRALATSRAVRVG
jgi:hypothetical protein